MCYHSDVTIMCDDKLAQMIKEAIDRQDESNAIKPDSIARDRKNKVTEFYFGYKVWGGYACVEEIEKLLDQVEDGEIEAAFVFLRVGETSDDDELRRCSDNTAFESVYQVTSLDPGDLNFVPADEKEELREKLCDEYCRFRDISTQEQLDQICENCPINRL